MISEEEISNYVSSLIGIAEKLCYNALSNNYEFIISEIKDSSLDFSTLRKLRIQLNDRKCPVSLNDATIILKSIYRQLYDVNFHIYRAEKSRTIIEIQYYSKDSLDGEYSLMVKDHPAMIHCKIAHPPYYNNKNRFDVNWESNPFLHQFKMFLWRWKTKYSLLLTMKKIKVISDIYKVN